MTAPKIIESNSNSTIVSIPKKQAIEIKTSLLKDIPYPDVLVLQNVKDPINCKIIAIDENIVKARMPNAEISALGSNLLPKDDVYFKRAYDEFDESSRPNLRETDNIKQNKSLISNTSLGKVKGSIVSNGKPLKKGEVRLYRLVLKKSLFSKKYKQAEYYETIMDENGSYFFEGVPAGAYKIFWKESLGKPWMRRMEMEPDIFVAKGELTIAKPFNVDMDIFEP